MTKQKKFKKKVRARMEETGERFTEAHAALEGDTPKAPDPVKEFTKRLLGARMKGSAQEVGAQEVALLVKEFHGERRRGAFGWNVLAADVLEALWPAREAVTAQEMGEEVQGILRRWRERETPEGTNETAWGRLPGRALNESQQVGAGGAPEVIDPTDDVWYMAGGPGSDYQASGEERATLGALWEHGPDVSDAFGMGDGSTYVSPSLVRKVVTELREMRKTGELVGGVAPDDFVEVADDTVGRYAAEVDRLRLKLKLSGIDPDEDDRLVLTVLRDEIRQELGREIRRIEGSVDGTGWPGFEVGFGDAVTSTWFACWLEMPDGTAEPLHHPDGPYTVDEVVQGYMDHLEEGQRLTWLTLDHPSGRRHVVAPLPPEVDLLRLPMRKSPRGGTSTIPVEHVVSWRARVGAAL